MKSFFCLANILIQCSTLKLYSSENPERKRVHCCPYQTAVTLKQAHNFKFQTNARVQVQSWRTKTLATLLWVSWLGGLVLKPARKKNNRPLNSISLLTDKVENQLNQKKSRSGLLKFALLNNLWCCYCQHRSWSLILLHSCFAANMPLSSWSVTKLQCQRTRQRCMTGNGYMISCYIGCCIVHSVLLFLKVSNKNKYSCVLINLKF